MTSSRRTNADREHFYICGRCGNEQYAVVGEELPVPCIDCGYVHRERKVDDLPPDIKLDLTRY